MKLVLCIVSVSQVKSILFKYLYFTNKIKNKTIILLYESELT